MSYWKQHQLMKPVLERARALDIATNPDPLAIFEAGSGGFQVWCTPEDHPQGWDGILMDSGTFSKPCEYVGSVHWIWQNEEIVALGLETEAYALANQVPDQYSDRAGIPTGSQRQSIHNREQDIEWLQQKITWLFEMAGTQLLQFKYEIREGGEIQLARDAHRR
ncbi:MAG: hypothetical protein WAN58_12740 [Anaerolineales bacterium]